MMKMREYETLIVLHPELPEAQIRETIDRCRRLIEEMGGRIREVQEWGVRELAYPIRKLSRGYYVLVEYTSEPRVVNELERTLKIGDEFLRFVSVASQNVKRREKPGRRRQKATAPAEPEVDRDQSATLE
jgi:small subunit ribosomal protein S6